MTAERERRLRTAQRKMLRAIVAVSRVSADMRSSSSVSSAGIDEVAEISEDEALEPWEDWIRRATSISEGLAKQVGIKDWTRVQRIRKWRLAGHIARQTDCGWSTKVLDWCPSGGRRRAGHPSKRWGDSIREFAEDWLGTAQWCSVAQDRQSWAALEEGYVENVCSA